MSLTAAQLEIRRTGIGGSDCAVALGRSKWKTARQLYHEKRGEIEVPLDQAETEPQWWGRMLEPIVRQRYAELTGRTVLVPSDTIRHPVHDFMLAHIDGYSQDGTLLRGYEGKTAMLSTGWGEEGTDAIPDEYLFQVHHYMIVTGMPVFDVATLIGRRFAFYTVERDAELHEMIIEAESDFMRRVREADAPPLDYQHKTALDCIKKIYKGSNGVRLIATDEAQRCRLNLDLQNALIKEHETLRDGWKAQLLEIMGEASLMAFPDGKCLRRQQSGREAYSVAATTYMDTRFINDPQIKGRKRK